MEGGAAVVVEPAGKVVVGGSAEQPGTGFDVAVAGVNPDGTPDES